MRFRSDKIFTTFVYIFFSFFFRLELSISAQRWETHRHEVTSCSLSHARLVLYKNKNNNMIIIIKIVGYTINKTKTDKIHCTVVSNSVKRSPVLGIVRKKRQSEPLQLGDGKTRYFTRYQGLHTKKMVFFYFFGLFFYFAMEDSRYSPL